MISEIPRICGGVSGAHRGVLGSFRDSPHLRGCFCALPVAHEDSARFPASAGVFPAFRARVRSRAEIPRICGGVSACRQSGDRYCRDSPHLRGCFHDFIDKRKPLPRFPASAGVFLRRSNLLIIRRQIPRICGGVSEEKLELIRSITSSPHLRGCFCFLEALSRFLHEFPASAGVFPTPTSSSPVLWRVPRICGGVSKRYPDMYLPRRSSPHLRGCFQKIDTFKSITDEFPASAGVFPSVSLTSLNLRRSSPHLRGCFYLPSRPLLPDPEFPASAGVFLSSP